jgi:hypothetical protein
MPCPGRPNLERLERKLFRCVTIKGLAGKSIMVRPSAGALAAISLVSLLPTRSFVNERCEQLEALHAQYAGVELMFTQKQLKRRLVA